MVIQEKKSLNVSFASIYLKIVVLQIRTVVGFIFDFSIQNRKNSKSELLIIDEIFNNDLNDRLYPSSLGMNFLENLQSILQKKYQKIIIFL